MASDEDHLALRILAQIAEPADRNLGSLVQRIGPAQAVQAILEQQPGIRLREGLRARLTALGDRDPQDLAARVGARMVTRYDSEWPTQLDDLGTAAPLALWVMGAADLRLIMLRSLAVVGARASTNYGEQVCAHWTARWTDNRITVVSGAAYGIDTAAHRGALATEGLTVAVVASGVDVPYPTGNTGLLARIADEGLVVSESPPGESVRRQRFLTRNRIIAALTRATIVVEAALRSGTTATANAATELQRPVYAVPGPVTSPMSAGCHELINQGQAILAAAATEVLTVFGEVDPVPDVTAPTAFDELRPKEKLVFDSVPGRGRVSVDTLVRTSALDLGSVLAALGVLETVGLIDRLPDGFRRA
jgi:DNA processing protein